MSERTIEVKGNSHIEMCYPNIYPDKPLTWLTIGLSHTRAADSIRVSYDGVRDGWKIEQASTFSWEIGEDHDEDWQEVAFIKAWARENPNQPSRQQ